ncbi:MAG: T9SS type A sorting domain-containing protein [Crocinitomicaceae bacterium]
MFPNPTSCQLNFQINSTHFSSLYIGTIYDKWGRIVEKGEIIPGKMYSYDASVLSNGVYYLKIASSEKVYSQRFVVSK